MDIFLDFFFTIIKYTCPILLVLIVVAKMTVPASIKTLKRAQSLANKTVFRSVLIGFCVLLFIILAIGIQNVELDTPSVLMALLSGSVSGIFIAGLILCVMHLLYSYLSDDESDSE